MAEVESKMGALVQKWNGFLGKVNGRVQDVIAEADAGLDELIAQHAMDHGPMGAAFAVLQTRFHGLSSKVSDAWEKIDEEIDEITEEDDLTGADWEAISTARDAMCDQYTKLIDELELHHYTIEMKKNADWARRLRGIAQEEMTRGVPCSQCGTPMQLENIEGASQQKCVSCGAVNDVMPGAAAALFYRGMGAHSLAQEQTWSHWLAERNAKTEFDGKRHPTAYDHWAYLKSAHEYWTAYYQAGVAVYTKFTENVAAAAEAKMKHYSAWDQDLDKKKREFFGQVVEASAKGDVAGLDALVGNLPHFVDFDECIECLVERRHYPAGQHLLGKKYDMEGEDDPKTEWVARELAEMKKFLNSD